MPKAPEMPEAPEAPEVTYKSARYCKHDLLNDYERRELDCWIAEHIEGHTVQHTAEGVKPGSDIRLSDLAWKDFHKAHPDVGTVGYWVGPRTVCRYSFSPSIALNVFQTNPKLADGWYFEYKDGYWSANNDGLKVRPCRSFALCLMLTLQHEWGFQNHNPTAPSVGLRSGHGPSRLPNHKQDSTTTLKENDNDESS